MDESSNGNASDGWMPPFGIPHGKPLYNILPPFMMLSVYLVKQKARKKRSQVFR
jgi:hypothetical protein